MELFAELLPLWSTECSMRCHTHQYSTCWLIHFGLDSFGSDHYSTDQATVISTKTFLWAIKRNSVQRRKDHKQITPNMQDYFDSLRVRGHKWRTAVQRGFDRENYTLLESVPIQLLVCC